MVVDGAFEVVEITADSAAMRSGLRLHDRILDISQHPNTGSAQTLILKIRRGDNLQTITYPPQVTSAKGSRWEAKKHATLMKCQ